MKHRRKKYVPVSWWFENNTYTHENFQCNYEEGIWDKYGLHYTEHEYCCGGTIINKEIHLKGKKYSKPPYAYNSYEDMMEYMENYETAISTVDNMGDIRKKAVYLILDLDEDGILRSDPCDFIGYVSKRGTVFNITSNGKYDGKKYFILTEQNKHLVFPDMDKAADYVLEQYGEWAWAHYLKSRYES